MKKSLKKNNKGFTLVELIVVVLIMAILSVALAPQVMKWVNNSRKSADVSMYDSVVSAVQLALSEEDVYTKVTGMTPAKATIAINDTASVVLTDVPTELSDELKKILGDNWQSTTKAKTKGKTYTITVHKKGTITKGAITTTGGVDTITPGSAPSTDMD